MLFVLYRELKPPKLYLHVLKVTQSPRKLHVGRMELMGRMFQDMQWWESNPYKKHQTTGKAWWSMSRSIFRITSLQYNSMQHPR